MAIGHTKSKIGKVLYKPTDFNELILAKLFFTILIRVVFVSCLCKHMNKKAYQFDRLLRVVD